MLSYVGSSLVGAIVGLCGATKDDNFKAYQTPKLAYRRFIGKIPKEATNANMQRGHDQEEAIAQKYSEVTGNTLSPAVCYQHKKQKWAKVCLYYILNERLFHPLSL